MAENDTGSQGRYIIQDAIGKGGSGSVFKAWDKQLGRYVAIKRINEDAEIEASIRQEAAILAALHHPNIVTIFDFDSDAEGPFVVMELVNGRTLEAIAPEHPLTLTGFFELANQVCHGLSAAHSKGLVHQDLKPGNLMLHFHEDRSFTLKILDFGLAKIDQGAEIEQQGDSGTVVGSAFTIAPEQLTRGPVDQRTDIYSLGVVFYFSITGRYPYDFPSVDEVVHAHLNSQPASLHLVREDVPEALSLIVTRMMAQDPDARPQTVEEVRLAVTAAARAPAAKRPVPLPAGTVRSSRKSPPVIAGAVALCLVIAVAWFLMRKPAVAPQAVVTAQPKPAGPPVVDPGDYPGLAKRKGETVVAEGIITSMANDDLYQSRDLKFSETDMNALILAFPQFKFTPEQVMKYVAKRVRVTGTISEVEGLYRIVIQTGQEIQILPDKQP